MHLRVEYWRHGFTRVSSVAERALSVETEAKVFRMAGLY
jgi:hypothetical protein